MQTKPFGSWDSPITTATIAGGDSVSIAELVTDGNKIVYVENRPSEKGRGVLMQRELDGPANEVTAKDVNVRTMVHEYGGGSIGASHGLIVYSNAKDSRLYLVENGQTRPLTPESSVYRYANPSFHPDGKSFVCVREDHTVDEPDKIVNCVVQVFLDGTIKVLAQGGTPNDFYSQPQFSPDGKYLSYLWWEHPQMPWTESYLKVVDFTSGKTQTIAGKKHTSISATKWNGQHLYYCDDSTGFWQLCRWNGSTTEPVVSSPVKMEFGIPEWTFGTSCYDFFDENRILVTVEELGTIRLGLVDVGKKSLQVFKLPCTAIGRIRCINSSQAVFVSATAKTPLGIYLYDVNKPDDFGKLLKKTSTIVDSIDPGFISEATTLVYDTKDPATGKTRPAYAFMYPPTNPNMKAPEGTLPPVIVRAHGGPTASCMPIFSPLIQWWTSRGFMFVDTNYSGSTGFGREYADRLNGNWGVCDVEDVIACAKTLAERGLVNKHQMAICGGSAGGLTTLLALATPLPYLKHAKGTFKTGTSSYGVADLRHLAKFTHKFELRYLDGLLGGTVDQVPQVYDERSPVNHAANISSILILQGADDKVVPPAQSESIHEGVQKNGGKSKYVLFEGESHGWRKQETIENALSTEYHWYCEEFGITPATV